MGLFRYLNRISIKSLLKFFAPLIPPAPHLSPLAGRDGGLIGILRALHAARAKCFLINNGSELRIFYLVSVTASQARRTSATVQA